MNVHDLTNLCKFSYTLGKFGHHLRLDSHHTIYSVINLLCFGILLLVSVLFVANRTLQSIPITLTPMRTIPNISRQIRCSLSPFNGLLLHSLHTLVIAYLLFQIKPFFEERPTGHVRDS